MLCTRGGGGSGSRSVGSSVFFSLFPGDNTLFGDVAASDYVRSIPNCCFYRIHLQDNLLFTGSSTLAGETRLFPLHHPADLIGLFGDCLMLENRGYSRRRLEVPRMPIDDRLWATEKDPGRERPRSTASAEKTEFKNLQTDRQTGVIL
jgi:hypothetical protein